MFGLASPSSRCRLAKTWRRFALQLHGYATAVAVSEDLRVKQGRSEAETFWTAFLRTLARRGLRGVKLVISDAHEGLKAAVAKVLHASWQRCRVHFMRNVLAHAGKQGPSRRRRLHCHRICPGRCRNRS